jgi:mono/diheme cytochrome c family protein
MRFIFGLVGIVFLISCTQNAEKDLAIANGLRLYQQHCMGCHGEKGEGQGLLYPPLAKSDYLLEDSIRTLKGIIYGMHDPILVNGQTYRGIMPAEHQLTDVELGYLMTFLYNSWGRTGGHFTSDWVGNHRK